MFSWSCPKCGVLLNGSKKWIEAHKDCKDHTRHYKGKKIMTIWQ